MPLSLARSTNDLVAFEFAAAYNRGDEGKPESHLMTTETIFTICNTSVLPFWLLLVLAPGWKYTQMLVHGFAIPILLTFVYIYMMISGFGEAEGASFNSLEGVMAAFSVPEAVLAGWIHYLIFDLFIGAWECRDARRLGISHFLVIPCMALTLMAGPVGLMLYLALRWGLKRAFILDEAPVGA